ncbi:MAG: hypothetical protein ACPLQP_00330, partial [Moorellaceae bacterium]
KVEEYFSLGVAGLGIPDVMGKLDISDNRAVLVFTRNGSYIHVYIIARILPCFQAIIQKSCA